MGFIRASKPSKKRKEDRLKRSLRKKHRGNPEIEVQIKTPIKQDEPKEPPLSHLERLPLEILHEIVIYTGFSSLPLVNKRFLGQLKPTPSLIVRMLKEHHIHDLDVDVIKRHEELGYPEGGRHIDDIVRHVLDKDVLKYEFVTVDVLKQLNFDTVMSLSSIQAEIKNRLILYHDNLNKSLLERLGNDTETSAEDINRELARMAEERFGRVDNENDRTEATSNEEEEDAELTEPPEDFQDFHKRFYRMDKLTDQFTQLVEYLHEFKKIKYINGDEVLVNLISNGIHDVDILEKYLQLTKDKAILEAGPLISAFKHIKDARVLSIAHWIVDHLNNTEILNDVKVWEAAIESQDIELLTFLGSKGAVPNHVALRKINCNST